MHIYPPIGSVKTYCFKYGNKTLEFEWHPYCGPSLLNKKGNPLINQPIWFLTIATYWNQDGRPLADDGLADFDLVRKNRYE